MGSGSGSEKKILFEKGGKMKEKRKGRRKKPAMSQESLLLNRWMAKFLAGRKAGRAERRRSV